jgi:hypothetical protein
MNKLILATGSDNRYLKKIQTYLNSIELNSNFDCNFLIYLGDENITLDYKKIKITNVNPIDYKNKNSINCLQHGEFLKSKEFDELIDDNDVIFYTDGDMILQRSLNYDELINFRNLKHGDVFLGYNESPNDNLKNEYYRLKPTGYIPKEFNIDLSKIKCYNTGVIGATKKTFRDIEKYYDSLYIKVDSMLRYYAKQQWLISFIIGTMGFNIIEMGYNLHVHTHYPIPKGAEKINDIVTYNGETILFGHNW